MAAAGPAGNLLIAFVAFALIKIGLATGFFVPRDFANFEHLVGAVDQGRSFVGELLSILLDAERPAVRIQPDPVAAARRASVIGLFVPESVAFRIREVSHTPMFQMMGLLVAWQLFRRSADRSSGSFSGPSIRPLGSS